MSCTVQVPSITRLHLVPLGRYAPPSCLNHTRLTGTGQVSLDPIEQPVEKGLWRRHGLVEATITISIYDPCRRRPYVPENHRTLKTLYFVPKMSSRRIPLRSHMPLKMPPAL
jgi:hypothetical protein